MSAGRNRRRTRAERKARSQARRVAGCRGVVDCLCLCHDTQGGVHGHYGRVCDGAPGIAYVRSDGAS